MIEDDCTTSTVSTTTADDRDQKNERRIGRAAGRGTGTSSHQGAAVLRPIDVADQLLRRQCRSGAMT